ncbi:MAG TPA: helix-turn-helix domain-containing GNAT family N-acetyltransferase [Candidatus Acidoferrales bacterium]|nr:helix-turn-helix domain-containing GNAT family N-acetyltransferase [Candidatus Acidoferrales bacterium]
MSIAPGPPAVDPTLAGRIDAIRRFNRFYTKRIGVLDESFLHTPFSLAEGRVLYEIAQLENPSASAVARNLSLDTGYLSRILRDFVRRGFVDKKRSASDGRQSFLALTARGRKALAPLDRRANEEVGAMLRALPAKEQARLASAMDTIANLLGDKSKEKPASGAPYLLRFHQSGDMGWIVHRHGVLYSQEYGYDEQFEALCARIVGEFIQNFDAKRERCWIAEREGEIVGSVFLVKKSKSVAKLRLLYVEPIARGLGIGRRLVEECIRFARQAGYKKITLWTQSHLDSARRIYKAAGFRRVHSESHHSFSLDLVAETWDLAL